VFFNLDAKTEPENTGKHVFRGGKSAKYYHAGILCNHKFCVIASRIEVLNFSEIKDGSSLELYIQICMRITICLFFNAIHVIVSGL
jgi:hypothetical protein